MKKFKSLPKFKNNQEEAAFWRKHDSVNYIDWEKAKRAVFPRLKSSAKTLLTKLLKARKSCDKNGFEI